jgi:RNA polymerase sigma factor (sigma-70 family)
MLLAWLDPDREAAGRKYEVIRSGLVRMFISRGFNDAEDLADVAIDRVAARLSDIRDEYVGEPARYFHGVARNIILEARRRKEVATDALPERPRGILNTSDEYDCLLQCLGLLPPEKRELILDFHIYKGRNKIEQHRKMAEELGITQGALRLRAHHIRGTLEKCVSECSGNVRKKQKRARSAFLERQ